VGLATNLATKIKLKIRRGNSELKIKIKIQGSRGLKHYIIGTFCRISPRARQLFRDIPRLFCLSTLPLNHSFISFTSFHLVDFAFDIQVDSLLILPTFTMADWSFYDYSPSKAGAIIALICYAISAGYHVFQMIKLKCYFFTTFIVGAISELAIA
jgi:hypothetical protein